MSKGDKDARVLQDATGARYTACLARVRALRALRATAVTRSALVPFLDRVEALPDLVDGQTRCVTCLHDLTPTKYCTCL